MPRTGAQNRGIHRERQVRDLLESQDWWVGRIAGSLGDVDLVASKPGSLRFIEVKSTAGGPYARFGPKDRADLSFAANLGGAEAWLVWWPAHAKPKWLHESEWPAVREMAA